MQRPTSLDLQVTLPLPCTSTCSCTGTWGVSGHEPLLGYDRGRDTVVAPAPHPHAAGTHPPSTLRRRYQVLRCTSRGRHGHAPEPRRTSRAAPRNLRAESGRKQTEVAHVWNAANPQTIHHSAPPTNTVTIPSVFLGGGAGPDLVASLSKYCVPGPCPRQPHDAARNSPSPPLTYTQPQVNPSPCPRLMALICVKVSKLAGCSCAPRHVRSPECQS
ncbi:hypothetical protein BDP55DRAFT_636792 [Colletotrichum godetiae]|uniref:Uncharacterized protein n=1 Tax=Colletotrichum godetiae TaxID=1209918 RepID=A0AAJ0AAS5_9PEZI|nr:uncharacterized protein BDP55DRAFT_636792 [Colletotrichum godetiae]KAK1659652.1 hypothetical protein BDP55DRAFT_636792 [Colletotrichum godetiae]